MLGQYHFIYFNKKVNQVLAQSIKLVGPRLNTQVHLELYCVNIY